MNISFYLIPKNEVTYIYAEEAVGQALRTIRKKGFQAVPVIDKEGRYCGTVTEGDFLWALTTEFHSDLNAMKYTKIADLSKRWDYKPVRIDAKIAELDQYITNQNFVPVVDDRGIFIGIITRSVIISSLLERLHKTTSAER